MASSAGRPGISQGGALVNRCQFVDDHRRRFGVARLCSLLGGVSLGLLLLAPHRGCTGCPPGRRGRARCSDVQGPSGLRRHLQSPQDHRRTPRRGRTGQPPTRREVVRSTGVKGVPLRRRHRATAADPAAAKAPGLIERAFTATEVNTKRVGDITYLPVSGARPLCLATVVDLASRQTGRVGHRRPPADRTRHRCPGGRRADLREPDRSGHAHRRAADRNTQAGHSLKCAGQQGLPEYGRGRLQRGQHHRGKLQYRLQESPSKAGRPGRASASKTRHLPPTDPIHHSPPALPPRPPVPDRLRKENDPRPAATTLNQAA